jgi:hypothetical protein
MNAAIAGMSIEVGGEARRHLQPNRAIAGLDPPITIESRALPHLHLDRSVLCVQLQLVETAHDVNATVARMSIERAIKSLAVNAPVASIGA